MPTDDEEESVLGDFIEDAGVAAPADVVNTSMLRDVLQEILQELPHGRSGVLELRYGLVDGETYTLEEVGKTGG
ncbi:MAG: hypothetical protein RMK65_08925 [Anaerolineae bacterium]|nr:hypothetical protein [Anaerolineae bacterium]